MMQVNTAMNIWIVLPILIPLLTAIGAILAWNWRRAQRVLSVVGSAALLGAGLKLLLTIWTDGILAVQIGNWPAPFGITLAADLFSAIMVVLAGLLAVTVTLYSLASMDIERESFGYYPILHILLMGVCGAFLSGDIFNLYVWFEVLLIASFVLLTLGGERAQLEGAIKYVTLNLMASALFLAGVGVLYGIAGTLNMADLAVQLAKMEHSGIVTAVSMLFLIAFGIKAAVFPLFFWLPASYHTPPVAVSAIFSGLLTKVGVYALFRVFTLLFVHNSRYTHTVILVIAGFTMVTGVLGAVAQTEFRRLLSFHIVSQIGYLLMGLGLYHPAAMAAAVFFMIHVVLAKSTLFLVSGVVHFLQGTYDLKKLGGLYASAPGLAVLFLIPALSLAGIPPLPGFFAKLALVGAGLQLGQYTISAVALAVSILTLFSMIKIWNEAFWKPQPSTTTCASPQPALLIIPIVLLVLVIVGIGFSAGPLFTLAARAAEQLSDPAGYIQAVLGGA